MIATDSIWIAAARETVWAVTTAVERWPEWTPTVTSARRLDEGPLTVGSAARLRQPGQPESVWTVTEVDPGAGFSWETRRTGLLLRATHALAAERGGTRNTLRVEASGWLSVPLWPVLRLAVPRALAQENRGLKSWCESARPMAPPGSR